ncbi:MAG: hypothetical protein JO075_00745 [Acidimicrobiia bacterium]|nr:hypothetical protein [Acidimicrobiia bacterium]
MRYRSRGATLAAAGLAALVLVLVATPNQALWVLAAWVLVAGGVAALAAGIALGFRAQADVERARARRARPRYLTADGPGRARLLMLDGQSAQPEELGDPVVATGEVAAVHGEGLAGEEGRVA